MNAKPRSKSGHNKSRERKKQNSTAQQGEMRTDIKLMSIKTFSSLNINLKTEQVRITHHKHRILNF